MSSASALACLQKVSAEILNGGRSEPWKQGRRRRSPRRRSPSTGARRSITTRPRSSSRRPTRPTRASVERFSEEHFPECFKEYADLLSWDAYWHTTLDTSNPPFWKWFVGGRLNACYNCVDRHLAKQPEQGGVHLRAGAGDRSHQGDHLPGAVSPGQRVRRAAARLLRPEGRRPRDHPHADGPRAADHDARLRAARRHSLGGVRRIQRRGVRRPDRRLGKPRPGDDGRLLPQRQAASTTRPRPTRRWPRPRDARCPGRQGPGLAPPPRPVRVEQPRWSAGRDYFMDELLKDYRGKRGRAGLACRPRRRCS